MSTITNEFTKEQLIEHLKKQMKQRELHIASPATDRRFREYLELEIATNEIALTSLEAEPYGYVHKEAYDAVGSCGLSNDHDAYRDSSSHIAVYTTPLAPVSVPDEVTEEDCPAFVKYDITEVDEAWARGFNACRAAMLQGAEPVTTAYKLPEGWVAVPVEPTEDMIVNGFESEPDESFSDEREWEEYDAMSGCQQAAHRAKLCWGAMIAVAPKLKHDLT